jgi:hypothetical protein
LNSIFATDHLSFHNEVCGAAVLKRSVQGYAGVLCMSVNYGYIFQVLTENEVRFAALYWCIRTSYGDDAAHAAADHWLRVFEQRLEGSGGLPELARITATQSLSSYQIIVKPSGCLIRDCGARL